MKIDMKVDGLRDIERALAQLAAGTAKGVVRRAMRKELKPVADTANALWPGSADDVIRVTSRVARSQPQPKRDRATVNMFVGAANTPEAHLVEFGTGPRFQKNGRFTGSVSPQPFLQPAWDLHKGRVLKGLAARLWTEIEATMARNAKRAAR